MNQKQAEHVELAKMIGEYFDDPLSYVMFAFPWDTDETIQLVHLAEGVDEFMTEADYKRQEMYRSWYPDCTYGPDLWACDFLTVLEYEIKQRGFDGRKPVPPIQFSTASGHGIGKSTLTAWLIKFIMDTRPGSKGTVTANTAEQLKTKTWAELGKWHKRSITQHWFNYTSGRGAMALRSVDRPDEWFCTAQTCREENSEAFAGQHAANATSFYIFDEASAVPDKIFEVREGGTTDGEPMTFDFGNPTRNSGQFYENMLGRHRHRYIRQFIDSRHVAITNKARLGQWVADYGEDSDFVKVRVRGQFPSAGSMQFIAGADVDDAMRREVPHTDTSSPLVIGVDVARYGDDETVIYPRLGDDARSFAPTTEKGRYRGLDTVQVTNKVIDTINEFRELGYKTYTLFIDETGLGAGVLDQLRHLGYGPIGVQFGSKPSSMTYRYRVDEMWGNLRGALPRLALPRINSDTGIDLRNQLTQREYAYTLQGNRINLESKRDMKDRLGGDAASPDIADALALTFAQDVAPNDMPAGVAAAGTTNFDYDPYANIM